MNEDCPEHYGWQKIDACTHCAKVALKDAADLRRIVRTYQDQFLHTLDCQVTGCRSKSEVCCACTCYVRAIRDLAITR